MKVDSTVKGKNIDEKYRFRQSSPHSKKIYLNISIDFWRSPLKKYRRILTKRNHGNILKAITLKL
jgi:hypothetical protein